MRFYTFGEKSAPVILLLSGTCCRWKLNFGEVIPLLEQHFHVVCVSYDGFDETEDTVFPDMLTETEKIEKISGRIMAATSMPLMAAAWAVPLWVCWCRERLFTLTTPY